MDCSALLRCKCLFFIASALCCVRQSNAVNTTSPAQLDAILTGAVNSATVPTQLPVYEADLNRPGEAGNPADAVVLFTMRSAELINYRVLVSGSWTAGWDPNNVLALYTNANITGTSAMVAILCGPMREAAAKCGPGAPNTDLVRGNLTRTAILAGSPVDWDALPMLLSGYLTSIVPDNGTQQLSGGFSSESPDQAVRLPGIQVSALTPVDPVSNTSVTLLTAPVVPANAAALPVDQLPFAQGSRADGAVPFHAFLWPVPGVTVPAAGSIALTMYNDSSLAYTIMLRRLAANDSVTSCTMESLDPALLAGPDGFQPGAFAWPGRGCCGGDAPNFFSSYPEGVQAPLDGSDFMLASGEWPPPTTATKQGRFVTGLLNDMQADNFLVGVRVRTMEAPNGLLLGEVVLGCGPDGLKLPVTDGCTDTISGNRRLR